MGKIKTMKKTNLITGTLVYSDVKNANGRIYTKDCMMDMLHQAIEDVKDGCLLGEFGYGSQPEVNLGNVSHKVTEVRLNPYNDSLEGTIEILETPKGKQILKMLNENDYKFDDLFVVRPRGTGTVNEKGEVENYTLYSFDVIFKQEDAFNVREKPEDEKFKIE